MIKSPLIALSHRYFNLVSNCLNELILSGNKTNIISRLEDNIDFDEATKWSDIRIIEPILFNFYHGIELMLKGILKLYGIEFGKNHNIETLYKNVHDLLIDNKKTKPILEILGKYTSRDNSDNLFNGFFKLNDISPKEYYIALRYPYLNNEFKLFNYKCLRYMENTDKNFSEEIISDIKLLKNNLVNL